MWEIKKYTCADRKVWNEFVSSSRNSTFLFYREFMEYHSDRFTDCSLLAFRNGKLTAILPANISGNYLYSHQGLTYGGWVLPPYGPDCNDIIAMWKEWLDWCGSQGIVSVNYKPLPFLYALQPSQEDLYLLFLTNSKLSRCDIASTIFLPENPGLNKLQKRHLKEQRPEFVILSTSGQEEAIKEKITAEFHEMLSNCLSERHETSPVHSREELSLLLSRFPDNIEIVLVMSADSPMAGVCLFKSRLWQHAQYIATSAEGRDLNMLTPLFTRLIEKATDEGILYFDFGISNEDDGRTLNAGLNRHKTSFGATGTAYQQWIIDIASASELKPI